MALFVPSLRGGGAERVAVNLAEGFTRLGVPTDLVAVSGKGEFAAHIAPGIRVVDLGGSRVMRSVPALANYLRRERPVAIISFMDHANIAALWARRLSGASVRVICTVHNMRTEGVGSSPTFRNRLVPMFLRLFYPSADEVVAVSRGVAEDLSRATGFPLSRVRVIYNPVITAELVAAAAATPPHPWLGDGGVPVVLGVGRLIWEKDFSSLIRAFAVVRRRCRARLLILGEGPERAALQALIQELGLEADVELPGFLAGAHACMARAAVFVLSSVSEGLPTVLIEAMAVGAPVVSTDCRSGPREILRGGELGRLVPTGDVDALAEEISVVLAGGGRRVSSEELTDFTQDAAARAYLRLVRNGGH